MSTHPTVLESSLAGQDDAAWQRAAGALQAEIHDVDRAATVIWLAFFPIALARLVAEPCDPRALEHRWLLRGRYRLSDQVDSSHAFLYGHRHWPAVKRAIVAHADRCGDGTSAGPLAALVREIAASAAAAAGVDRTLVTGIALIGLHTLQQVGLPAFRATDGAEAARHARRETPEQVLRARARDDRQGVLAWLKGQQARRWTVTLDERDAQARFPLVHTQAITTAAAADRRDWRGRDPRCTEGPIPVHCRSASCGTCWVGVLGGAEKLSAVEPRERAKLQQCGYAVAGDDPRPVIRLACQAQAGGAISIVIPPWHGIIGKAVAAAGPSANIPVGAR